MQPQFTATKLGNCGRVRCVWTIGHSNHGFERFAALLEGHGVELVADVRSRPYSRFAPWSNRERLSVALASRGVPYEFFGQVLGGRPDADEFHDPSGHALYERMAREPAFGEAIERVLALARERRVALLCSEGDPKNCHRRLLVGKVLCERGATLQHILPTGEVRAEDDVPLAPDGALFAAGIWRSARPVRPR